MKRLLQMGTAVSGLFVGLLLLTIGTMLVAAWDTVTLVGGYLAWFIGGCFVIAGSAWVLKFAYRQLAHMDTIRSDVQIKRIERNDMQCQSEFKTAVSLAVLPQIQSGLVYPQKVDDIVFASHTSSLAKLAGKADGVPQLENMPDLMSHIADCANVLVIGGKGSGKTTLLQWLEAERIRQGKILVLDSHAQPSQWQSEVIGIGRDYGQIKRAMVSIVNLLDKRYKTFVTGQKHFELIWSIVDEFTLLPRILKDQLGFDVKSYSYPILTEGRKVGLNCIWGSHSDRAEALGLTGAKDLIECFDVVVYLKNTNNGHYALCDFGEGKQDIRYRLPGPFVINGQAESVDDSETKLLVDDMPTMAIPDPIPDDQEKQAIVGFRLVVRSGEFSWNKATQAAFGEGKVGKNYQDKLRRILDKFQVDYSEYVSK